ncbi:acyl-CoA dehydrogenase [Pseudomonas gingeri]|uniref:Acyl-CoA dehydrogenase n=1 Tax=Pseudomonas gingeri TaxID=117681 RepID=A0A7Y8C4U0_9PSED|nr:acyl-CoA dehydrogenase [Pseudomonas gingeri]NWB99528.1 acyl-CoA dehydrogenase [Pseudomonas gingeri]
MSIQEVLQSGVDQANYFLELTEGRSLLELEQLSPHEVKGLLSKTKLPALIIPRAYGGLQLPLKEALDAVGLVAGVCPSAALMLCMHYHVVSTIAMYPAAFPFSETLLNDISLNGKLVASAFAESSGNQDIFHTSVAANVSDEGIIKISGSKKPCTMSHVADYYAVSIITAEGVPGIAILSNGDVGLKRKTFWPGDILLATDSHEIIFEDVTVKSDWVVWAENESFELYLNTGLVSFNLFICAAYTGACQALSERLSPGAMASPAIFIPIKGGLAQCRYSVLGIAESVMPDNIGWLVPEVLALRYQIQRALKEIKICIFENFGAQRYLADTEAHYLAKAVDLLAFHPVTRFGFEQQMSKGCEL